MERELIYYLLLASIQKMRLLLQCFERQGILMSVYLSTPYTSVCVSIDKHRILHDRSLPRAMGSFNGKYECYSPTVHERPDMENTGKMLLPPSALEELAQDPHIELPWLFCLIAENGARAYCGVQEFVAPEGKAFVPNWVR